jgi:hypothetical protein
MEDERHEERPPLSRESIVNVIHQGIKADIELLLKHRHVRGALILLYTGIDTLATISMPEGQDQVRSVDFKDWATRYIELDLTVSADELWGARCGLVHSYGSESRASRRGDIREIGYIAGPTQRIVYPGTAVGRKVLMLSAEGLVAAFFRGIDRWLIDVFGDPLRRPLAERRLRSCIHEEIRAPIDGGNR